MAGLFDDELGRNKPLGDVALTPSSWVENRFDNVKGRPDFRNVQDRTKFINVNRPQDRLFGAELGEPAYFGDVDAPSSDTVAAKPIERKSMSFNMADTVAAPFRGLQKLGLSGAADAFKRATTSLAATQLHAGADFLDQTIQAPARNILGALGVHAVDDDLGWESKAGTAATLNALGDPLGFRGVADQSLAVEHEINLDRQAASKAIGGRPALGDLLTDPAKAIEQYTAHAANQGIESLPAYALAIASRNPTLGSNLLAATSGAAEYTDLRDQGIDRRTAAEAGVLSGLVEKAGEDFSLPKVMSARTDGSLLGAAAAEAAQEVPTQLGQGMIEDRAIGRETPIMEQLGNAFDAAVGGGALGGGGHLLFNAGSDAADLAGEIDPRLVQALGTVAPPANNVAWPAAAPAAAAAPPAATAATAPTAPAAPAAAGMPADLLASLPPEAQAAVSAIPAGAEIESMDDLDALLAGIAPLGAEPEAAPQLAPEDPAALEPLGGEAIPAGAEPDADARWRKPDEPAALHVEPAGDGTTMQNRDRSRVASVAQMQDIRKNPDAERLGYSRDPNTGAPMVGRGRDIPAEDLGRSDSVTMASGRRVPVQYAVVEADDLAASHDADGKVNPGYAAAPLRALNNGRVAGLQAAWRSGNAGSYATGIAADSEIHGVSPAAIASKRNPVLIRTYDPALNTGDMGAESNASAQLGMSPTEQAQTDARSLPDLSGITWGADGNLGLQGNVDFFRSWFRNMGDAQAASLQDAQGRPNAAAIQRVRGAMVQRAYGDERLLTAMAEEVNPDNRNVMNALVQAAPAFASLDQSDPLAREIRQALVGGLEVLRSAASRGLSITDALGQGDLLGRNPNADAIARFMTVNARSANRMAEAFRAMAEYADNAQAQSATLDVFGTAPEATISGALDSANVGDSNAAADTGQDARNAGQGDQGGQRLAESRAPYRASPPQGGGLFGNATPREEVDAAGRGRDDARNGRTGTGRTDMAAGAGDLFAGPRPQQADLADVDQTETPAFKRWFGDSKVVDANGAPLVVYRGEHGADDGRQLQSRMSGITFTDDAAVASTYAMDPNDWRETAEAPRVTPAYLRIANPIIENRDDPFVELSDLAAKLGQDEAVRIARKFADNIENTGNWEEGLSGEFDSVGAMMDAAPERVGELYFDAYPLLDDDAEVARFKAAGYDGAIHVGNGESAGVDEFRVFDQAQVKSATGNSGAFDPANPSIDAAVKDLAIGRSGRNESAATRALVDAAAVDGDVTKLLRGIADQEGLDADQRALALRLAEVTPALNVRMVAAPEDANAAGIYNGGSNEIWIHQALPSVVLHEVLHGVTSALLTSRSARATEAVRAAQVEMGELLSHVQQYARENGLDSDPRFKALINNPQGPLSNTKELLTYGMTDSTFQDLLRRIPAPPGREGARTAWDWFKGLVWDFIGVPPRLRTQTTLDALIETTGDLVDFAEANPKAVNLAQMTEAARRGPVLDQASRVESGDMFVKTRGQAAAPEPARATTPPAEAMPPRVDASPVLLRRADNAIDDLVRRNDGSILADTLARSFRNEQTAQLIGQTIRNEQDLAALSQVYRNPLFETMHYVFVDAAGKVLGESAYSDRMPSAASIWPEGAHDGANEGVATWIASIAPKGTTGIWMMHNHPSGNPTPSRADLNVTRMLGETLQARSGGMKLKGHVVLNHQAYGRIGVMGNDKGIARIPGEVTDDPLRHQRKEEVSVFTIDGPSAAASAGKYIAGLAEDPGSVAYIVVDARLKVIVATSFPLATMMGKRGPAILSQIATRSGGSGGFLVLREYQVAGNVPGLKKLARLGLIMDAISVDENGKAGAIPNVGPGTYLGAQSKSRRARDGRGDKVHAPQTPYTKAAIKRNVARATLPATTGAVGWNYDRSEWQGKRGALKQARMDLQDKMIAWRDVQGQIEEKLGAAIPDAQNVYRLENLMHGRAGEALDQQERAEVLPLVEAMRKAGVSVKTLEQYLYARHAEERNKAIAAINLTMQDGGSGMKTAEANRILAQADTALLDPLAAMVDKITRNTRRRLLDAGLITQAAHDAMDQQYDHYVPLRGKEETDTGFDESSGGTAGRGLDTRGKPIKNALGRGAGNLADNILAEVIGDAQRSIITAEKARVGRAVMRTVLSNPNPDLWTVEKVNTERTLDAAGMVTERVVNDWSDPSVIGVRHRGVLYKVQINSQPLAQALNNVGTDQLGTVTRAAGKINRYFSAVLTKYNPAFLLVNASRDALFGMVGVSAEHGEAVALDAAMNYPMAIQASAQAARGVYSSGKWGQRAKEFAEAGGKTGYVNMPSIEDLARKIGNGNLGSYSPTGLLGAGKAIVDAIGVMNDAVENALRLSVYVALRDRGMSEEQAAAYAKNVTVNFNRKGLSGSKLNAWFLFYNASIQGGHRVGVLFRKPKAQAYLGMLAGIQVIAAMAAMGMTDDDGEPLWEKVPDHVKRRNLVIVLPSGHVLTIPMPYGFNLYTYTAGRFTSALLSKDDDKDTNKAANLTADLISAAAESMIPVPIGDGAMGLLPTVLRIPVNVQTNRNDFGRSIRREDPYSKSAVPRASMGQPDTLELFKLAATGLNRVGGGDSLTPPPMSAFDVAPEDLEYLLAQLTGGTGKFLIDVATVGQKLAGGDTNEPTQAKDIPISKRFVTNIDAQAATAAAYYDRRETIDRGLKKVRVAVKAQGVAEAEKLMQSMPELQGATLKRRKGKGHKGEAPGSIILTDGMPQIVPEASREPTLFGAYRAAEKAIGERNEAVELAFELAPPALIPTAKSRQRDLAIKTSNRIREAAQNEVNHLWLEKVVGITEADIVRGKKPVGEP